MVHAIQTLKCKKGHILPISYDRNECGCHHDGKACIIINCKECFRGLIGEEYSKGKFGKISSEYENDSIQIPLDKEGVKIIEKLVGGELTNGKTR